MASLEGARVPMPLPFSYALDGIFDPLWKKVGGNEAKLGLSQFKSGPKVFSF